MTTITKEERDKIQAKADQLTEAGCTLGYVIEYLVEYWHISRGRATSHAAKARSKLNRPELKRPSMEGNDNAARPDGPRPKLNIRVEPAQMKWILAQQGTPTEVVGRVIDEAMKEGAK